MPLVIAGFGITVFALLAAVTVLGSSQTHTATHGGAGIRGYLDWLTHGGPFTGALNATQKAARYVLSRVAGGQVKHLTMFFGALAFLTGETYKANANTAEASAAAAEKIKHELKAAEKQLHREVVRAEAKLSHELHAAERKLGAEVKADERRIAHLRPQVAHATHAVDVALPRDIAGLRKRNETLSRDQAKLKERTGALEDGALDTWKWIRTHPLAATTGVFAGAVAIALQRFGLGNLRCRNFTNLLKHYGCGFGTLLARLLPLAVLLAVAFDFPDFVRASRVVAAGIGDAVQKLEGQFDPHLPPLPPPRG